MENKLEQLLNSLIEAGWKPFGLECKSSKKLKNGKIQLYCRHSYYSGYIKDIRQIVSKESGLWQFVCENGMVKKEGGYRAKRRHLHGWEHDEDIYHDISHTKNDYEYYLIESSLKDESELEEFLLNSIKLD